MRTNEQLMKACQIGCNNLNDANNLLAECYGRIGRLTEENERLRKDAERYRWFRVNENWRDSGPFDEFYEADLDVAIDAARGAK